MKKILLVEDSRALRALVSRHLKSLGWQTLEADDGLEGVLLALQHKPDLILLDVSMPNLDGPSALLKIRNKESIRNTPVVMMTAASDRQTVMKLARLGIQDYIVKPFSLELLASKVENVLGPAPMEGTLAGNSVEDSGPVPGDGSPEVMGRGNAPDNYSLGAIPMDSRKDGSPGPFPGANEPGTSWSASGPDEEDGRPVDDPDRPNLLLVGVSPESCDDLQRQLGDRFDIFVGGAFNDSVQLSFKFPPHALILDLNNESIKPIELYKRLKYLPHLLQTPLIAIRHPKQEMQERAERVGVQHFITPPINGEKLAQIFETLDHERQRGRYGENYVHLHLGYPVIKWPEDLRLERLTPTTYAIEDNLVRVQKLNHSVVVVQIGAIRRLHDGHLKLMLAIQKQAARVGLELAYVTQNQIAKDYFQKYQDTRNLVFHPTIEAGLSAMGIETS